MRKINTTALYNLGKQLQPLDAFDNGDRPYGDIFITLYSARIAVEGILADQNLSLRTCRQAAIQFIEAINRIIPADFNEMIKHDRADQVNWWLLQQAKGAASRFETVFTEELGISDTYAVTQKGAYSTSELISHAEVVLPQGVRDLLPPKSLADLREAGRCLAYETPTAAGFHIVRAIEAAIVAYYAHVLKKEGPPRMRNWGVYIRAMREAGGADDRVLDLLEHIKDNYRNPISHPEAILTIDEVLVLFAVAVGAMTQIALALQREQPA